MGQTTIPITSFFIFKAKKVKICHLMRQIYIFFYYLNYKKVIGTVVCTPSIIFLEDEAILWCSCAAPQKHEKN
jgi:hypothetical protein